jgi:hypothetical protein
MERVARGGVEPPTFRFRVGARLTTPDVTPMSLSPARVGSPRRTATDTQTSPTCGDATPTATSSPIETAASALVIG